MRCEDYPCCGHTDGLPCDWTPPDGPTGPHDYCDHENGFCEVVYGDDDEYADIEFEPAPEDTPLALDT